MIAEQTKGDYAQVWRDESLGKVRVRNETGVCALGGAGEGVWGGQAGRERCFAVESLKVKANSRNKDLRNS